jgi:radical S-adenosyl methionine domain-containing protein 2
MEGAMSNPVLLSVNFHLWKPCNLKCRFCFATFRDVEGHLSAADAARLLPLLRVAGGDKLTFAGGEPTLCPHLGRLLTDARRLGFTTSVVTNGERLRPLIESQAEDIDWIGLSVDSARERTQSLLGRGEGGHVARSIVLFELARAHGIRVKLNTVVTSLNWDEDMSTFVQRVRPERWKVFQVLPIEGQNDGMVEPLLITREQFRAFVDCHAHLGTDGLAPVAEDNDAILGSYAMIDPLGRFFGDSTGRHVYSDPILEVGVERALSQVGFEPAKLVARGGVYDWSRGSSGGGHNE